MSELFRVFISHNYADRHHVPPLVERIKGLRMSAYVDWLHDIHLDRDHVDRDTAELLRQRLQQVRCLIFLVSPGSGESKWMPWELGFFDGAVGRVGIWSVPDPEVKNFPGQEYLALYERVTPSNLGEFLKRNAGLGAPGLAHPRAIDAGALTLNRMPHEPGPYAARPLVESRLFDLNGEAKTATTKHRSARASLRSSISCCS